MKKITFLIITFSFFNLHAQEIDTTATRYQKINWFEHNSNFEKPKLVNKSIVPLAIMGLSLGINTKKTKSHLQTQFQKPFNGFTTNADDYLQYAPVVILYSADLFKVKARNSVWNQTKYLAISEFFTSGIVQILKYSLKIERPDQSAFNSFPSGHTSQAFVTSQVLFNEFYQSNKGLALSGFFFSIPTGGLRVINNRHWVPDVLMGAGIAILVTNLVYHFEPLKNWNPWKKEQKELSVCPSIGYKNFQISLNMKF